MAAPFGPPSRYICLWSECNGAAANLEVPGKGTDVDLELPSAPYGVTRAPRNRTNSTKSASFTGGWPSPHTSSSALSRCVRSRLMRSTAPYT